MEQQKNNTMQHQTSITASQLYMSKQGKCCAVKSLPRKLGALRPCWAKSRGQAPETFVQHQSLPIRMWSVQKGKFNQHSSCFQISCRRTTSRRGRLRLKQLYGCPFSRCAAEAACNYLSVLYRQEAIFVYIASSEKFASPKFKRAKHILCPRVQLHGRVPSLTVKPHLKVEIGYQKDIFQS